MVYYVYSSIGFTLLCVYCTSTTNYGACARTYVFTCTATISRLGLILRNFQFTLTIFSFSIAALRVAIPYL